MLRDVPVGSACINIITQDRGTRIPPVKSFSICCRLSLRIGVCPDLRITFHWIWTWSGSWKLKVDSELELDWRLEEDLKLDKGLDLESAW